LAPEIIHIVPAAALTIYSLKATISMYTIYRYQTSEGRDVFGQWLGGLRDLKAKARIAARIDRLAVGSLGDCKPLTGGVAELRVDYGPGYRVYFARVGKVVLLLLGGGDKCSQQEDIARAVECLIDYKRRLE